MSSLIQRVPQGFLDALGIKSTGTNPNQLSEDVRPVVNLIDFYLASRYETVIASGNITNNGDIISLDVPAGEAWAMQTLSGRVSYTAGTDLASFHLGYRRAAAGSTISVRSSGVSLAAIATAQDVLIGHFFPQLLILPPGSRIVLQNNIAIGGARAAVLICDIARLSI